MFCFKQITLTKGIYPSEEGLTILSLKHLYHLSYMSLNNEVKNPHKSQEEKNSTKLS